MVAAHLVRYQDPEAKSQMGCNILSGVPATVGRSHIPAHLGGMNESCGCETW